MNRSYNKINYNEWTEHPNDIDADEILFSLIKTYSWEIRERILNDLVDDMKVFIVGDNISTDIKEHANRVKESVLTKIVSSYVVQVISAVRTGQYTYHIKKGCKAKRLVIESARNNLRTVGTMYKVYCSKPLNLRSVLDVTKEIINSEEFKREFIEGIITVYAELLDYSYRVVLNTVMTIENPIINKPRLTYSKARNIVYTYQNNVMERRAKQKELDLTASHKNNYKVHNEMDTRNNRVLYIIVEAIKNSICSIWLHEALK